MEHEKTNLSPLRQGLTVAAFFVLLVGLTVVNILYTPPEISVSERRRLAAIPSIIKNGAWNHSFMEEFEAYTLDGFVHRDGFRRLKAVALYRVFLQKDNNGIYLVHGSAAKVETVQEASVQMAADKILRLTALLEGLSVYYTVIPDKGAFLAEGEGVPAIDYHRVERLLADTLGDLTYINLRNVLKAEDYYKTDLHWDQSRLAGVAEALGQAMGFEAVLPGTAHVLEPFYGVYYGQSALPLKAEALTYLTGGDVDSAVVSYLNAGTLAMEKGTMYDPEKLNGIDPYDVFLGGAQPLIAIENPNAETDRQLYLLRDSFSSSLAPLLVSAYSKITLIDLRYLASPLLPQLVEFVPGSDVLFAYGAQILNSSGVLLVSP